MSGVRFNITSGAISTGGAAKTFLQVIAASNHRVILNEFHVAFQGIVNTDSPFLLQIIRGTTGGSGSSSATPTKEVSGDDETLQVTANKGFTSEPTGGTVIYETYIHPQGGLDWVNPKNPLEIQGGSKLDFKITSGASYNGVVMVRGEE